MTEYPPRSCGPCPNLGRFQAIVSFFFNFFNVKTNFIFEADDQGDYLNQGTVPKPQLCYEDKIERREDYLGVPTTNISVDLEKSALNPEAPRAFGEGEKSKADLNRCSRPCLVEAPSVPSEPCDQTPYDLHKCDSKALKEGHQFSLPEARSDIRVPKGILKTKGQVPCPCENMSTIGRNPPGFTDPSAAVPVPNDLRPDQPVGAPCYLPQPEDLMSAGPEKMGPIGPWATGRLDWGPLAGLTGTRPVVDKYSIARFSEGEWRKHNKEMLDLAITEQHKSNLYVFV